MKQIHFATKNPGKVHSLQLVLSEYDLEIIQVPLEMPEPRSDFLDEIARTKVLAAYAAIQKPCIAVDAGCFVDSLHGFPGSYVNYVLRTIGIDGILRLVEGKPREASLKSALAYYDGTEEVPRCFSSGIEGTLSLTARGEERDYHWSRLFKIFIPRGREKTLAEMSPEEYQAWRHETSRENSFARDFGQWYAQRV
ncbi:MAG: non-canonical purine NTP pyrophosphatase [Nanoarchaeota archaeon]